MPHVIIKLWPGRSEEQKQELAKAIVGDMRKTLNTKAESCSVAFEEVDSSEWKEKVYQTDILDKLKALYVKLGYSM